MRRYILAFLVVISSACTVGQSFDGAVEDPRAMFAELAPYYNFMDPSLKPWHVKVDVELPADAGKPSKQEVFEYWWASPKVYRSSWKRSDGEYSEWHTDNGRSLIQSTGEPLGIYEHWLQAILFSALPGPSELDPRQAIIVDHSQGGNGHSRCLMIAPAELTLAVAKKLPFANYPEYCVNKARPYLLGTYPFPGIMVRCVNFTSMQGKTLPRELGIIDDARQVLKATVQVVDNISGKDPAFKLPKGAAKVSAKRVDVNPAEASGLILKQVPPITPEDAKGIQGKVVLKALIGADGGVEDLRLISSTKPSMAVSAFRSVSQWRYKPYRLGNVTAPIATTVLVSFEPSQTASGVPPHS